MAKWYLPHCNGDRERNRARCKAQESGSGKLMKDMVTTTGRKPYAPFSYNDLSGNVAEQVRAATTRIKGRRNFRGFRSKKPRGSNIANH